MLVQVMIGIFGLSAVFLVNRKDAKHRKLGCMLGLCAQPFWFWATYSSEQWVMFVLCFFYTYSWLSGLRHHK